MLSVCIPIYNFDVRPLVQGLAAQIKAGALAAELVLIDDASETSYELINAPICAKHNYTVLSENVGRAKIRNLFVPKAKYDYLLFLDCDVQIQTSSFLDSYIKEIKHKRYNIICGGRIYPIEKPAKTFYLNWKYGTKIESKEARIRNQHPNRSFMSNNFVINKAVFEKINFDEFLKSYGHEDTLFGIELSQEGYSIFHIENPVINGGLDNNYVYLEKTMEAVENLLYIEEKINDNALLCQHITLFRTYYLLRKYKITTAYYLFFLLFRKVMQSSLVSGPLFLPFFNLYKLGVLIEIKKKKKISL